MKDLQKQLANSIQRHAEAASDRFQTAHSPLVAAAWDAAMQPKPPQRVGKSGGKKFWLPEADDHLVDDLTRKAGLAGIRSNRSQIVRAGVHLLSTLSDDQFNALIETECAEDEARGNRR